MQAFNAIEFDVSLNSKIHKKDQIILTLTPFILLASDCCNALILHPLRNE